MKFKKLASLLVVAAMMFAMAVPAFAWDDDPTPTPTEAPAANPTAEPTEAPASDNSATSRSVTINGTTKAPTINVDVATSMDIILNPYGLTVEQGSEEVTDQLISSTLVMKNQSDCVIEVTGTFTATVAGNAKLVSDTTKITGHSDASPTAAAGDKNVVVGIALGNVGAEDAEIVWKSQQKLDAALAQSFTSDYATKVAAHFDGFSSGTNDHSGWYLAKTSGTAVNFGDTKDVNTGYAAAAGQNAATNGEPYQLGAGDEEPTYMAFRVFGVASTLVKEAWTDKDTVSGSITLSFTPRAVPAS